MNQCSQCGRKANRQCPKLQKEVCSRCCGDNRHSNGECPDICPFLLESRRRAIVRLVKMQGSVEFEKLWFDLLHDLRLALVQVNKTQKTPLIEEEILAALENIIENRRVQSAGLIYEYKSINPDVQHIMDVLNNVISRYETQPSDALRKISSSDLTGCLRYLHHQAKTAKARGIRFLPLISTTVGSKFIAVKDKNINLVVGRY